VQTIAKDVSLLSLPALRVGTLQTPEPDTETIPPPPTIWASLREFGAIPVFFASLIGIGSTTELIQFFFGDLSLSDFLEKWLETWAYYNEKIRIVLLPLAEGFGAAMARLGLSIEIDPIWINFFWIFMLPGVGLIRLMRSSLPSQGRLIDFVLFGVLIALYAVFALLLALSAGAFPNNIDPYRLALGAYAPILLIPVAGVVAAMPVLLFAGVMTAKRNGLKAGAGTFFSGLWTFFPGRMYFKTAVCAFVGLAVPVFALASIPFPEQGPGLLVYYVWLLVLGIWVCLRPPKLAEMRQANGEMRKDYMDTRPIGLFILGGFALTVVVLGVDWVIRL